jgi:hypothetical protein
MHQLRIKSKKHNVNIEIQFLLYSLSVAYIK